MTVPAGSILEVNMKGAFFNQEIHNVFHYRIPYALDDAEMGVAGNAFWDSVKAAWRAVYMSSADLAWQEVFVGAVGGTGQYGSYSIPTAEQLGTRSPSGNSYLPPFNAFSITFNPALRLVRPGSKRIAGVTELDNSAGTIVAGTVTLLNTLANALKNGFNVAGRIGNSSLVIYSRGTLARPTPLAIDVTSHRVLPNVSTQNSRKIGHGM